MAQDPISQPDTAETRFQYQANKRGICDGQIGSETVFSPSISIFPCQYDSKNVPCSFIHLSLTA
jgi:hypothetical protein